jgi:hypothetical protein
MVFRREYRIALTPENLRMPDLKVSMKGYRYFYGI